ncbi:hypothetical protein [Brumimicrobium sp.]|uniref:hypothetical protein n=1 Tax=Brumimicrobium sp. TaxID=2029867 RepID=UPI003A8D8FFE
MKLKVLLSILTIGAVLFSSNTLTAQSITPNTFILQPYIGAPNMKKWIYDTEYQEGNKSSGFGHVGLSGELTVSERFGIGFDAIYSPFSRESVETISEYDPDTDTYTTHNEVRAFDEDKLRLIAKVYIHFNVENPKWDIYISGGVGANIIFAKAYIDGVETDYQSAFVNNTSVPFYNPPFPFSGRFCFGTRYFFSDHFGVNFEAGVGGPPFSFGLNVRF